MKTLSSIALVVVASIAASVTGVWAIVAFILYLVKDIPFNWWSVWAFVISLIMIPIAYVFTIVAAANERKEAVAKMSKNRTSAGKKSRFQQRLEEMQKQQATTE